MVVRSPGIVTWLVPAVCLYGVSAWAQEDGPPRAVPTTPPPVATSTAAVSDNADGVTLNFAGADLVEVIHVLARHLRLNYSVDSDVQGVVTLFSGQPVRRDDLLPILHELLRIHGAVAVKQGTFYRITAISKGPALVRPDGRKVAGVVMQVLPVRFLPVAAMKRLLTPFMGEGGTILDHVRGNYLVVIDLPSNIRRLAEIQALIDVEVLAGTRMELYRPRAAAAHDLARELSAAMRFSLASAVQGDTFAARFLPLPRINQLLVIAYSDAAWNYVKHWLERIDVADETATRKVFIRAVENRKAAELAQVLSRIYGSGRSSVPRPQPRLSGPGSAAGLRAGGDADGGRHGLSSARGTRTAGGARDRRPAHGEVPGAQVRAPDAAVASARAGTGVRVVAEPDTNSLVILATPREYSDIVEVLGGLDLVPRQVLMEVLVAEVTLSDDFEFGVEYALSKGGFGSTEAETGGSADATGLQALDSGFASIIDAGRDFRVFVRALMQDARVKVLSSPHLLAVDNRPARIRVGSEQPVATGVVVSQEAQATTTTIQFKNVGRILTIIPRINSEGLVNLQVRVEVSNVGERVMVGRQSFDAFNVRDAETTAVLQDGQTLVIGGIITDSLRRTRIGIPLLMNVPVLGPLFRTDLERSDRTELVILITPRVIRNRPEGESVTERFLDQVRAVRRELEAGGVPTALPASDEAGSRSR